MNYRREAPQVGKKPLIQLKVQNQSDSIAEQLLRGTFKANEVTKDAILRQKDETGIDQPFPTTDRSSQEQLPINPFEDQRVAVPDLRLRENTAGAPKENVGFERNFDDKNRLQPNNKIKNYLEILESKYNRNF